MDRKPAGPSLAPPSPERPPSPSSDMSPSPSATRPAPPPVEEEEDTKKRPLSEPDLEAQAETKKKVPPEEDVDDEDDDRTVESPVGQIGDEEKGGPDKSADAGDDAQWEVKWDEGDPEHPHNWGTKRRWFMTFMGGFTVLNVTFASSAPSENTPSVMRYFGFSEEVAILAVSLFVAGFCAGPLLWGPGSEIWGRRPMMLLAYALHSCFNLGCALAPNTGALLAFRFLAGAAGSAPPVLAGAILADMWDPKRRGLAMSIFALTPFAGPALGPVVAGAIETTGTSWRWTYWVLTIFACFVTLIVLFCIPETYGPVLLVRKAERRRKSTGDSRWWAPHERKKRTVKEIAHYTFIGPFKMLIQEPMLLVLCLYSSFIFGMIYLSFEAFPFIFTLMHGLNAVETGLTFLAMFVGGFSANMLYIFYLAPLYGKHVATHAPEPVPAEERLPGAMIGGVLFPLSLFWLAWSSWPSVSIWAPIFAVLLFGFCILSTFLSLLNYIVDTYLYRAASAIAINLILRSLFGAGFPLFATQMYDRLGVHWATSLLGFIALAGAPIPFVLYRYGAKIRKMSKNAPTAF